MAQSPAAKEAAGPFCDSDRGCSKPQIVLEFIDIATYSQSSIMVMDLVLVGL